MSDQENIVQVSSMDEYEESVDEHDRVLVDFRADWCGPCKRMDPIVEEIAEDLEDEDFVVLEVDIDEHQDVAAAFDVRSIPTFLFYHDGEVESREMGVQQKDSMVSALQ